MQVQLNDDRMEIGFASMWLRSAGFSRLETHGNCHFWPRSNEKTARRRLFQAPQGG
jgi:hypothetical protein